MKPKIDVRRVLEIFLPHSTALTEKQLVQHFLARHPPPKTANQNVVLAEASCEVRRKLAVCVTAHLVMESRGFDFDSNSEVLRYTITPSGCDFISHR